MGDGHTDAAAEAVLLRLVHRRSVAADFLSALGAGQPHPQGRP
jgi:hypothetical protein